MALGAQPGLDTSPAFDLAINGYDIDQNVLRAITSVEYDSGDGLADQLKLNVANPNFLVSDSKLFRPGNIIKLWGGYGSDRHYIGGAMIEKVRPDFPAGGSTPTIEIVAFTADTFLARGAPPPYNFGKPFSKPPTTKAGKAKLRAQKTNDGRTWPEGLMYSDAIAEKASYYGFKADIDETPDNIIGPLGVFQKADMSDFDFISAIANELGWLFWVSADEFTNSWILHFRDPDLAATIQRSKYDFAYNSGDQSTCLSFEAEEKLGDSPTELQVQYKNTATNTLEVVTIAVDPNDPLAGTTAIPDQYSGIPSEESLLRPANPAAAKPQTGAKVTIAFGGVAVRTIADREFGSIAEVAAFAKTWYLQHMRDFTECKFSTMGPGSETLSARQVHSVSGVGIQYTGDYYLTNVVQSFSAGGGHSVSASGRKIKSKVFKAGDVSLVPKVSF